MSVRDTEIARATMRPRARRRADAASRQRESSGLERDLCGGGIELAELSCRLLEAGARVFPSQHATGPRNVDVGWLVPGRVHIDAACGGAHEPELLFHHVRILSFGVSVRRRHMA